MVVSIHAPRAGRDILCHITFQRSHAFQSTRPVRGATKITNKFFRKDVVSIHAPRAGRDEREQDLEREQIKVSIHAPRAGRDQNCVTLNHTELFQSTRPVRGATS